MDNLRRIHEITSKKVFGEIISDFCYNGQVRAFEGLRRGGIITSNNSQPLMIKRMRYIGGIAYILTYFAFYFTYRSINFDDFKQTKFVLAALALLSLIIFLVSLFIIFVKNTAKDYLKKSSFYIVLAIAGLVISTMLTLTKRPYFMWDTHDMFRLIDRADFYSLFNFKDLALSHHVSYSFSFPAIFFKLIFGSSAKGQAFFGYLLFFVGVIGFYKCCEFISKNSHRHDEEQHKNTEILLNSTLTLMYAVSPYMLGMITYSYPDYAIWCLTPILTYLIISKKYEWTLVVATIYVFMKETAVISYVLFVIGVYIVEAFQKKKFIHDILEYLSYALPCFAWLFSYLYVDHWNGGGTFTFSLEYIYAKLASYFLINFNWILIVFAIGSVLLSACNRKGQVFIYPIIISMIGYFAFSVTFNTVIHPRYIDAIVAQLYLLVAVGIIHLKANNIFKITLSTIMSVILLIQSFNTIDPIMLKAFDVVNVGAKNMVTTSELLSDGMAYNRQYQYWGVILDKALEDIATTGDMIYMPATCNDTWHFDAMGHYIPLNGATNIEVQEKWNSELNSRMTGENDQGNVDITITMITEEYEIDLLDGASGHYLYTDYAGSGIADKIFNNYDYELFEFRYKGFIVYRIDFWRD